MVNVFDIFKGHRNKDGKVQRIRKLGHAYYCEDSGFCEVKIHGSSDSQYILEAENSVLKDYDYNIFYEDLENKDLERVGVGYLLHGPNVGLVRLEWDSYDNSDAYIDLSPSSPHSSSRLENSQTIQNSQDPQGSQESQNFEIFVKEIA